MIINIIAYVFGAVFISLLCVFLYWIGIGTIASLIEWDFTLYNLSTWTENNRTIFVMGGVVVFIGALGTYAGQVK